ncbi:hypothetical protein HMPREF1219_01689 [Corynebacterium pyruviciproducens ATCC BAA-1742]|uniref:Uncharacterized protein n=1 Tax=Corynebacterium pyruviciproducens ATCC BAA-1742 TaxID=1125779 RepID=S2YVW7_9CORY|nr:hypothetical protein HMPREF1219_01689 [Corynebacterium pyruviciproducens ATCC BAA-1742]
MNTQKSPVIALGVLATIALIGWISGETLWAAKIVTIAGFGCALAAYFEQRKQS